MRFIITVILAVAVAVGAAWYFKLFDPFPTKTDQTTPPGTGVAADAELGDFLYPPEKDLDGSQGAPLPSTFKSEPLTIPGCHLAVFDKRKIPSQREGVLLFVGQEITQQDPIKPGTYPTLTIWQGEKELIVKSFKRWEEDNVVKPGEMLAIVNPALAMKEFQIKLAQVQMAKEEYVSAGAVKNESEAQWKRAQKLGKDIAPEELSVKKLMFDRYVSEERVKFHGIQVAKLEADKAEIFFQQHTVFNDMKGTAIIKHIFKKDGEAIKGLEDFMELHNIEVLRAEGTIGAQYKNRLKKGLKVTLDPVTEQDPKRVLRGHTKEITGVAFSNKGDALIVTASTDQSVRVWRADQSFPTKTWMHPREVQAVVCSPKKAERDLVLSGCADGSLRLWDLTATGNPLVWTGGLSGGAGVTALAFSPDGRFFATGGDDNTIRIWNTATHEELYTIDSRAGDLHHGTVTSLHFTPQCRLVSASRDNTLRVWELHEKNAKLLHTVANRVGTLSQPGVSHDGRWMLFDWGKELRLLSVIDGQPRGNLQNPMATSFETMALFSPDLNSSLLLTAGAAEGKLQLWKTPVDGQRPYEVRQWVPEERSPVTCAAFAPNAGGAQPSLAVTGSKAGHVYLWNVPGQADVDSHPITGVTLDQIDYTQEGGSQYRFSVNVPNPVSELYPRGKLNPGGTVHVVIE